MNEKSKLTGYWLKAIKNTSFGTLVNEVDEKVLLSLESISTNVTTDSFEITFEFSESDITTEGIFVRRLTLANGQPISFDGDVMKVKEPLNEGLFETINTNTTDPDILVTLFGMIGEIINEVVPYSL